MHLLQHHSPAIGGEASCITRGREGPGTGQGTRARWQGNKGWGKGQQGSGRRKGQEIAALIVIILFVFLNVSKANISIDVFYLMA